jgi:hypothetical protein
MENFKLAKITKKAGGEIPLFSSAPNSFRAVTNAEYLGVLNGEDSLSISIESADYIELVIGDYILFDGKKFSINTPIQQVAKNARNRFEYNLKFEGEAYILQKCNFFDTDVNGVFTSVFFTAIGDLEFWANLIVNNIHRSYPNFFNNIIVMEGTDEKQLTFSKNNCLEALQSIIKEFDVDYKVVEHENGDRNLVLTRFGTELPYTFEYGYSKGLYSISRNAIDSSNVITRLYVTGSNKNLPTNYRDFSPYLKMTNGDEYLQDNDIVDAFGIIEGYEQFEDIFPTRTASITGLTSNFLELSDSTMNFNLNSYLAPGVVAKINMKSGNLSGYTFDITNYNDATKTFRVKQFKDSSGTLYPNQTEPYLQFGIGDKYTLIDILPPTEYIADAEARLKTSAIEFYNKVKRPKIKYSLFLDSIVVSKLLQAVDTRFDLFRFGDLVKVVDTDFALNDFIRVLQVKIDILNSVFTLELAEYTYKTIAERVVSATKQLERIVQTNTNLLSPTEQKQYWQQSVSDIFDLRPFEKLEKGLAANTPAFLSFNSEGVRLVFSGDGINDTVDTETPNPTLGLVWAENHKVKTTIDPMDIDALNLGALFSTNGATLQNIAIIARAFPKSRPDLSLLPDLNFLGQIGTTYMDEAIIRGRYTVRWEIQTNYESYANGYTEYLIATPTLPDTRIQISRSIKKSGGDLVVMNKSTYPLIIEDSILGNDDFLLEPNEIVRLFLPETYTNDNTVKYIAQGVGSAGATVDLSPFEHFEFGFKSATKAMIDITDEENTLLLSSDASNNLGDEAEAIIVAKNKKVEPSNRGAYFEAANGMQENIALRLKATAPDSASTTPDYIGGKKGLALNVLEGASILKEISTNGRLGRIVDLPNTVNAISIGFEEYVELNPTAAGKTVFINAGGKTSGGGIVFYNRSGFTLECRYDSSFYFQLEPKSYVELMVDSDGVSRINNFFGNSAKLPQKYAFLGGLTVLDIYGSEFLEVASSSSNPSSPTRIQVQSTGQGLGKELFIYNASSNSVTIENTITGNANFALVAGSYIRIKKVTSGWIQA